MLSEQHTSFLLKGWPLLRNPECFLERTITLLFWCTMGQTIGTSLLLFSFVIYYQYTRSNIFADLIIVLCCPYMMGKCNGFIFNRQFVVLHSAVYRRGGLVHFLGLREQWLALLAIDLYLIFSKEHAILPILSTQAMSVKALRKHNRLKATIYYSFFPEMYRICLLIDLHDQF